VSWDRPIGLLVLAALAPAMLFVSPLLVALAATGVLAGIAICDAARGRERPPEPPSPPSADQGDGWRRAVSDPIRNSCVTLRRVLVG
jgi:hypothetical protein